MPGTSTGVRAIATVAVVALLGGPLAARQAGARAAIEAANKKFSTGAAKADAALIASVYSEDAEAYPPNAEVVRGRAAIQKLWQSVLDSGITGFELNTRDVEAAGNLAYESGTYALRTKDGKVADRGKYCVVWKRVQGRWLLHRDIWNTNMPADK